MKSLVIYYSHRGNTAYVARCFFEAFQKRGEANIFELKYIGGENLLMRLLYRFTPSRVQLATVPFDLEDYNVLCLGIPVIGGYPSSAITKYISLCENTSGKKVICCYVYGVEASADHCATYIEKQLKRRGTPEVINVFVPWYDVLKENFLDTMINETFKRIS
ncbi:MAG: hypothetical protein PHV55_00445 [Candidatus Omnitrophica bacterium]|nr:hypothetical protein [Candidatus Omnitrophota bacterium]